MRALFFVVTIVLVLVITTGGGLALVAYSPEPDDVHVVLASLAMSLLVLGPVLGGAFLQWTPSGGSARAVRRQLHKIIFATAGLQAIGAVGLALISSALATPPWVPLSVIAASLVLSALSFGMGAVLRRRYVPMSNVELDRFGSGPEKRRLQVRRFVVTGVLVGALVMVIFSALLAAFGELDGEDIVRATLFGVSLAFMVVSMMALRAGWPLAKALRSATGEDLDEARAIGKAVLRKKPVALDEDAKIRAARYAVLMRDYMPFQAIQSGSLLLGIGVLQLSNAVYGEGFTQGLAIVVVAMFAVLVIALTPLQLRQWRRVTAYAVEHGALAEDSAQQRAG